MKIGSAEVTSKEVKVGTAEYDIYDSLNEAMQKLGEKDTLKLINAQTRTNALNAVRSSATGKPSKASLRQKAMAMITQEDFISIQGDETKFASMVDQKITALEAAWEKDHPVSAVNGNDE